MAIQLPDSSWQDRNAFLFDPATSSTATVPVTNVRRDFYYDTENEAVAERQFKSASRTLSINDRTDCVIANALVLTVSYTVRAGSEVTSADVGAAITYLRQEMDAFVFGS